MGKQHTVTHYLPSSSTPFAIAPSNPRSSPPPLLDVQASFSGSDFDFNASFSDIDCHPLTSADELFHNGEIRPLHQIRSGNGPLFHYTSSAPYSPKQHAYPCLMHEARGRGETRHERRIGRSLSPLRVFHWDDQPGRYSDVSDGREGIEKRKQWIREGWTLKELLRMGGGERNKESKQSKCRVGEKANDEEGRVASMTPSTKHHQRKGLLSFPKGSLSPHELHYTKQRQHAEQMKKRTFLPYRQGLLGCLGFSFFPEGYNR